MKYQDSIVRGATVINCTVTRDSLAFFLTIVDNTFEDFPSPQTPGNFYAMQDAAVSGIETSASCGARVAEENLSRNKILSGGLF